MPAKLPDAVWRRHANPWSVWTRLLSVPLVSLPFWSRSWSQGCAVGAWMALNPLIFPEPPDETGWATRAIRGERQWLEARRLDGSAVIQGIGSAALAAGCYAAHRRRLAPVVASAAVVIACNAWFLDRMART